MKKLLILSINIFFVSLLNGQSFSNVAAANDIDEGFGSGNLGGGVSFMDFNGDGWDDLTCTSQFGDDIYFYQNNGGTLEQISPLVSETLESKDAIWVDYDNDGDKDLFVTNNGGQNKLYRHSGFMTFTDVTASAGLATNSSPSFGACWGDFNRDGWLDLYVSNLVYESSLTNEIYLNDGDGTFTDISNTTVANNGAEPSFDAVAVDTNRDLWPDIYLVNDKYGVLNAMYHNNLGTFENATAGSNTGLSIDAMNAGGSDFDNDGDIDLYVTNTPGGNVLLRNSGSGVFTDVTAASGVAFNRTGWAATFFDYDNDMDKDLYVSCVSGGFSTMPNAMYVNQGNSTFTEPLLATGGLGGIDLGNSFGHAVGDINNDGQLDIAVSQMSPYLNLLWQNDEVNTNNWIKVKLTGVSSNADGIGATIDVYSNDIQQTRHTHCSMGYLSQHSDQYHFGLANNLLIDSIVVFWPSGIVDRMTDVTNLNRTIYITESSVSLPVRLSAFDLEGHTEGVQLKWETAIEENTSHFVIERSQNGKDFRRIGKVEASGNSTSLINYQYLDKNVSSVEYVYYRLRIVDFSGEFEHSPIRAISFVDESNTSLRIHNPINPITDRNINFSATSSKRQFVELKLFSRNGQLLQKTGRDLQSGVNALEWHTNKLPSGSYFVTLEGEGVAYSFQVILLN